MPHSLAQAFLFGATLALAIGPIALLILSVSAEAGLRDGVACGAGAALADALLALVAYLAGAALLRILSDASGRLAAVGGAVLLVLGLWLAVRTARAAASGAPAVPQKILDQPLASTCALTLANPLTLVIFAGFAPQLALARAPWLALACAIATGLGSLVVQVALAGSGAMLGRVITPAVRGWLTAASGVGIALFGVAGLWHAR